MTDITELTLANWQTTSDLLRHLSDNGIDSDSFAVTHENENGRETECELSITEFALRAAADIDAMLDALAQRDAQIAALEESLNSCLITVAKYSGPETQPPVPVKLPKQKIWSDYLEEADAHRKAEMMNELRAEFIKAIKDAGGSVAE